MDVADILTRVRDGSIAVEEAERMLRLNALVAVEHGLTLDVGRQVRTGVPEVVLAEGKTASDVREAAAVLVAVHGRAIVTRLRPGQSVDVPDATETRVAKGVAVVERVGSLPRSTGGRVAVVTAGASDRDVADEVRAIAEALGVTVWVEHDVGVASLARALAAVRRLHTHDPHVWIVVAGREAALAPVVAGLVHGPVIGVPVSTGYGHAGAGEAALSSMLQACTPLLTVNIDAGFVAGAAAAQIANRMAASMAASPTALPAEHLNKAPM